MPESGCKTSEAFEGMPGVPRGAGLQKVSPGMPFKNSQLLQTLSARGGPPAQLKGKLPTC